VIQRKISHALQAKTGAVCRIPLLTVCTSTRHEGRDLWDFLEQAWNAHRLFRLQIPLPDSPEPRLAVDLINRGLLLSCFGDRATQSSQ
jgi:hypothetical protein